MFRPRYIRHIKSYRLCSEMFWEALYHFLYTRIRFSTIWFLISAVVKIAYPYKGINLVLRKYKPFQSAYYFLSQLISFHEYPPRFYCFAQSSMNRRNFSGCLFMYSSPFTAGSCSRMNSSVLFIIGSPPSFHPCVPIIAIALADSIRAANLSLLIFVCAPSWLTIPASVYLLASGVRFFRYEFTAVAMIKSERSNP